MSVVAKTPDVLPEKSRYKPETAAPWLALYNDSKPGGFSALRENAYQALEKEGLPTPRLERWKYTNLIPQVREIGKPAETAFAIEDADKLVQAFGDITANPQEWLENILSEQEPGIFRYNDMALWHLGNLFLRDGIVIDVPAGKVVETPLTFTVDGRAGNFYAPRIVIRLGEGAELTAIERHEGQGKYWTNQVTQIAVGQNAKLRHYRIQDSARDAVYTQTGHIRVDRDATYEGFTFTVGGGLSRNQVHAQLTGVNGNCHISGVNLLRGSQHSDTTVEVEHQAEHGTSSQFMRSVLDDRAHGIFQGKVYVHRNARKTDGSQLSNALLLSEGAEMDTRPELEIYADDVKCAHGATTGRLQDEPLFYLRSRGLPEEEARRLLIEAFVGEVMEKIGDKTVRETVLSKAEQWLRKQI